MTVAVCMIVKDGAATIGSAIASARPHVDEVCIYDTGSIDGTLELLQRLANLPGAPIKVERGEWRDDFAWAREQSFAMASEAVDWLMWLDADDIVIGGPNIASVIQRTVELGYPYVLAAYDAYDGMPVTWRERIVPRGVGSWEGIVHEHYRMRVDQDRARSVPQTVFHVRHLKRSQQPGRYVALLERAAEDPLRTPRALFNLGHEYAALGRHEDAARVWLRYLREGHDAIEGGAGFRERVLDNLAEASRRVGGSAGAAIAAERETVAEIGSLPPRTAGRNAPCPCGSGLKFKKCHGR